MTPYGHAEMQLRQPLQTSCWMKTVSNSVRVMAPVGQTSRQLAFLQCLQTSLIISQACPPAMGVGCTSVPRLSGTCSMNCTCRQFCASSWPVLSKESARNCGLLPSSWFHSLHATSQALQPMRLDVRQDRQPARLGLPAERARHARERPARRTARAVELALRRDERLVRLAEHRELR